MPCDISRYLWARIMRCWIEGRDDDARRLLRLRDIMLKGGT